MTKKHKSHNRVGFLLDETGSMQVRKRETIVAVNNYFKALRKEKAIVTFATFDTAQGVNFRYRDTPAKKIYDLTNKSYVPNAMTPLHDAVGKMIGEMEQHVKKRDKVLIVVVTDGEENSSREFTLAKVQELIKQKEDDGWAFAYVGASPDAWAGGGRMGVAQGAVLKIGGRQMVAGMAATSDAMGHYFRGHVKARKFFSRSRHLVDRDKKRSD